MNEQKFITSYLPDYIDPMIWDDWLHHLDKKNKFNNLKANVNIVQLKQLYNDGIDPNYALFYCMQNDMDCIFSHHIKNHVGKLS